MFKPGGEVTITMIVAKNVEPIGRIARNMVNGKTFEGMDRVPSEATKQE
jgi:hypothetical protein